MIARFSPPAREPHFGCRAGLLPEAPRLYLGGCEEEDGPLTEPSHTTAAADPLKTARRLAAPELPRRFYRQAQCVEAEDGRFQLRLDGRPARTPAKNPLAVPGRRLAAAIEAEWRRQGERIDPATMPVTRLANSAIDGVAPRMAAVRADLLAYAGSDLLCYRAGEPEGLAARQRERWDPVLAWAERRLGARFVLAEGVMHVAQPPATLDAVAAALCRFDEPFALAALPEALPILAGMGQAAAARRLSRRSVLVRRSAAIETLGVCLPTKAVQLRQRVLSAFDAIGDRARAPIELREPRRALERFEAVRLRVAP